MTHGGGPGAPVGLLLDYGGVLTTSVVASFRAWEDAHGLEPGEVIRMIRAAYSDADGGLIGGLERGEIDTAAFDVEVASLLEGRGVEVSDASLVAGWFAGMRPAGAMWDVAQRARAAGVPTGLLSNSWGTETYPRRRLEEVFDVLVISGEVGLRKPDPAIYELAAGQLGLPPHRCAFVDDLPRNVEVAESLGMYGVVHTGDDAATTEALSGFLGIDLDAAG